MGERDPDQDELGLFVYFLESIRLSKERENKREDNSGNNMSPKNEKEKINDGVVLMTWPIAFFPLI